MFNPFFHPLRHSLVNYAKVANGVPTLFESLQSLSFTITESETFKDVTLTEVDLSRAVIFMGGWQTDGNTNIASPRLCFTSSTNVRATRGGLLGGLDTVGHFFVVELPASQVNSIQSVEIFIPSGSIQFDQPITPINLDKSVILHCGQSCDSSDSSFINLLTDCYFYYDDNVRAKRGGIGTGHNVTVNVIVLECK